MSNPDFAGSWQDPGGPGPARTHRGRSAPGQHSGQPWSQDQPSHRQGRRGTRERGRGDPDVRHASGPAASSGAHAQPGYGHGRLPGSGGVRRSAGYAAGGYPAGSRSGGQGGWRPGLRPGRLRRGQPGTGRRLRRGTATPATATARARRRPPGRRPGRPARAGPGPDRPGHPARPRRRRHRQPRWPRRPGRPRRARRQAAAPQGQLVAALDLEEGPRRGRLPDPGLHPHRGRRHHLAVRAHADSRRRVRRRPCSSPRPSTSPTARPRSARSAHGTNRQLLQSSQIPTVLKDAVIAAEDRNFWTEGGISPTGILRAAYAGRQRRRSLQGGSTHHRAVRQELLRDHRHLADATARKLKEIFVAIKLSHDEVQGLDPDPVPEHDLPRRQRLRRRRGLADLLRQAGAEAQRRAGRHARRDDQPARVLQPAPGHRGLHSRWSPAGTTC